MKKLLLGFTCGMALMCHSQTTNWGWAKSSGGTGSEIAYAVTTDPSGNVYTAGAAQSSYSIASSVITNNGMYDYLLIKYDAMGNPVWAHGAGGSNVDRATAITADASGIYVVGYYFSTSITLGSNTFTNTNTFGSTPDIFILKYDNNGNILWSKSIGGTGSDIAYGIALDLSGNICITGNFASASLTIGTTTLSNVSSNSSLLIAKFDTNGNAVWAKSAQSAGSLNSNAIASDSNGNYYITGGIFSNLTIGTTTLTNNGNQDLFIAKYDGSGNVVWAKSTGTAFEEYGTGISTDGTSNIFVTGSFSGTDMAIGTVTVTNNTLGYKDMFIAKYDVSGNPIWASRCGGNSDDFGSAVTTDATGNTYVLGEYSSPSMALSSTTLTNPSTNPSLFITKYDAAGNVVFLKGSDNNSFSHGLASALDATGNLYVSGYYAYNLALGTNTLTSSNNSSDLFVAKLATGLSAGVHESSNAVNFKIYPNPTTGLLNITDIKEKTIVFIYDLIGNIVIEKEINENTFIDFKDFSNGIYTLMTQSEHYTTTNKIILSK